MRFDTALKLRCPPINVELLVRDDAFALRPDVDEDLVLVDPDDAAFDDIAVLEALDVGVLLGEELLHRRRLRAELAARLRLGGRCVLGLGGTQGAGLGGLLLGRLDRGRSGGFVVGRYRRGVSICLGSFCLGLGRHRGGGGCRGCDHCRRGSGGRGSGWRGSGWRGGSRFRRGDSGGGRGGRRGDGAGGGGLVSDGDRRDGLLGRLVGGGGECLRLRRGPAHVMFGQLIVSPNVVVHPGHANGSGTARAVMTIRWSVLAGPRSAPS